MIQTSQAFINAINQSSRQWRARFLYNGADTGATTKSITVKGGSQPETAFNLCGIYGASFEAVIDTLDGFKWEDKIITPQLGLVLQDESVEWISLGVFTITEVRSAKYQTTIIGVGNLTANGGKSFTLPATQSVNAIINAITSEIGVTINLDASFDGTTVIDKSMAGLSVQEALQVIASILGGFVADKYNGSIMVAPYPTTPTTTIDTSRMTQEPTFADYDNQITGVHVIVSPAFVDEDGQVVPAVEYQTATPNITMENPYMTAGAFTDFADAVVGLTWRTANVPIALGDPRYEATDMIEVTVNGDVTQTYYVPCFNFVHHFDGGLQTTVIAYGDSESLAKTEQGGAITRQLKEIQGDILRVDKAIVQTLEVGDHFFVGQDGHVHITEEPKDYTTGNNIYIDSDSVDVRQGEVSVASFGKDTRLGAEDEPCLVLTNEGIDAYNQDASRFFSINMSGGHTRAERGKPVSAPRNIEYSFLLPQGNDIPGVDDTCCIWREKGSGSALSCVIDFSDAVVGEPMYFRNVRFGLQSLPGSRFRSFSGTNLILETSGTSSAVLELNIPPWTVQEAGYEYKNGTGKAIFSSGTIGIRIRTVVDYARKIATIKIYANKIGGTGSLSIYTASFWGQVRYTGDTIAPSFSLGTRADNGTPGIYSVTQGENLYANSAHQTSVGLFNRRLTEALFVVGNGLDDAHRNDAFVVDPDGNIYADGDATIHGNITIDSDLINNRSWDATNKMIHYSIEPTNPLTNIDNRQWKAIGSFTLPEAGDYMLYITVRFAQNNTGQRLFILANNGDDDSTGSVNAMLNNYQNAVGGFFTFCHASAPYRASGQTTLYLKAYQNSGGALDLISRVSVVRLR